MLTYTNCATYLLIDLKLNSMKNCVMITVCLVDSVENIVYQVFVAISLIFFAPVW